MSWVRAPSPASDKGPVSHDAGPCPFVPSSDTASICVTEAQTTASPACSPASLSALQAMTAGARPGSRVAEPGSKERPGSALTAGGGRSNGVLGEQPLEERRCDLFCRRPHEFD